MKRNSLGVPEKGFTLVEIMVALSLLLVVAIPVPAIFSVAARTQQINKAKNIAANIATQELEKIRNLSYDDVGTDPGNPGGSLSKADDITVETIRFRIERRVVWVDDAFDGQEPNDPLPADYKRATVVVSSIDMPSMTPVTAATLVSRRGEETMSSRGNIRVHVLGADEEPIRGVRVDVGRGSAAPFRDRTNSSGRVLFPALRPSDAGDDYEIGASKGNYVSLEPQPLRATVTSGNTRHVYVHLDLPGHLIAHVVDAENNPIQDSQISLARADSEPRTRSSATGNFDALGLFPGSWEISASAPGFAETPEPVPFEIDAGQTTEVDVELQPVPMGDLEIQVFDAASRAALGQASVQITADATGELLDDETDSSGVLALPREAGQYTVEVHKTGYGTQVAQTTVNENEVTTLSVFLEPETATGSIMVSVTRRNRRPVNNVWVRAQGTDYDRWKRTGTYGRGKALFDDLESGRYRVFRWRWRSGWVEGRSVTVSAGQRTTVIYD